jgi:hypothetical protein
VTIQLDPGYLSDTQTQIYTTTYINVVDDSSGSNVIVNVANVVNVTFSSPQPNVSLNVSSNLIWVNGIYTLGNTSNIMWFDAPYGSALSNTPNISFSFSDVPTGKFIYAVNEGKPDGQTITMNFTSQLYCWWKRKLFNRSICDTEFDKSL